MIPPFCDDSTVPGLIPPGHAMEPRPVGVSSRIRSNSWAPESGKPRSESFSYRSQQSSET